MFEKMQKNLLDTTKAVKELAEENKKATAIAIAAIAVSTVAVVAICSHLKKKEKYMEDLCDCMCDEYSCRECNCGCHACSDEQDLVVE